MNFSYSDIGAITLAGGSSVLVGVIIFFGGGETDFGLTPTIFGGGDTCFGGVTTIFVGATITALGVGSV